LFDAWWLGRGLREPRRLQAGGGRPAPVRRPEIWSRVLPIEAGGQGAAGGPPVAPEDETGPEPEQGEARGRLLASRRDAIARSDLRHLNSPEELAEAQRVALRLAQAMRYRLSRRRVAGRRGRR